MGHELRFRDGVPIYDGTAELFERYRREALVFAETLEWRKSQTAAPRLIAALEGAARVAAQQRPSAWFSHPKGVEDLLDHLKATMKAPTLPDAGRHISRFFYGLKRRKGESMAAWLVRHDEALDDVRRTLSEAIREYGPKTMAAPTATTTPLRATTPTGASHLSGDIYDELAGSWKTTRRPRIGMRGNQRHGTSGAGGTRTTVGTRTAGPTERAPPDTRWRWGVGPPTGTTPPPWRPRNSSPTSSWPGCFSSDQGWTIMKRGR